MSRLHTSRATTSVPRSDTWHATFNRTSSSTFLGGLSGSPASRPEIDAVVMLDRRVTPIEIKAYLLDTLGIEEIIAKYTVLGFRRLIIVAPSVSGKAARRLCQ